MTKQVINIGSSPNDGTGSTIRTAFDMANDNFSELYARQSPVSGASSDFINAVKYIEVNEIEPGYLLYIGEIVAGTFSMGDYSYYVAIWKTNSVTLVGALIMQYYFVGSVPLTGLRLITLSEFDGSGYNGKMVINWSALTIGSIYPGDDWSVGGLMAIVTGSPNRHIMDSNISVLTDIAVIDGSKSYYVLNPSESKGFSAPEISLCKGIINISNISLYDCTLTSVETFNLLDAIIYLKAGKQYQIIPYDGNYLLTIGDYTPVP